MNNNQLFEKIEEIYKEATVNDMISDLFNHFPKPDIEEFLKFLQKENDNFEE